MKTIKIVQYDVFSKEPGKGNPAAVVLKGDELTEEEMQAAAHKIGFNETIFLMKSEVSDYRLRYFTPGHEMNLCGHGTMAAVYALKSYGLVDKENITIETNVGVLPIHIEQSSDMDFDIVMKQATPEFKIYNGTIKDLADVLGLDKEDIDSEIPIIYGSTGIWTLLVPIKELNTFLRMNPKNELFPSVLKEIPHASVHPFCFETYHEGVDIHARHFSSPFSGTKEDPVTGTASGVLGAYYARYINNSNDSFNLIVEQGQEIEKDGQVRVKVTKNEGNYEIEIKGNAVYVKEFSLSI